MRLFCRISLMVCAHLPTRRPSGRFELPREKGLEAAQPFGCALFIQTSSVMHDRSAALSPPDRDAHGHGSYCRKRRGTCDRKCQRVPGLGCRRGRRCLRRAPGLGRRRRGLGRLLRGLGRLSGRGGRHLHGRRDLRGRREARHLTEDRRGEEPERQTSLE